MSDHKKSMAREDNASESEVPVTQSLSPPATSGTLLGPEHWPHLSQDPDLEDNDSALGDSDLESSASLTSTILRYRTLHGRTYHSDVGNSQYWATNDDRQNEAMDINHHVITLLLDGKLYAAPLQKDIQKVVDIGTGTGIWAIDFADEFPNAQITGTDISPIQPNWVPPNLQFQIDDCTQEWTFPENSIDYVHVRWLLGSVMDWPALFKQAYKSLAPGGYIESQEPSASIVSDDGSVHEKSAMNQWGKFFVEGGRKLGRPFTILEDDIQKKAMEEAGFVDIKEIKLKTPVGPWPEDPKLREIGTYMQFTLLQDIEGSVNFMADLAGWTRENIKVYAAHFRREILSKDSHPYFWQKVVVGRKPA